ncbi:TIGR04219 family outer membrane beta-barrel protein [Marinobacter sp. M216]|uniref:TIGR04219 family outer membrane beta-barrel protein n=1 Tax=Marinobacter albus TaxID=3030833 RepID=A0ABT7HDJ4_9GAMM|nr:MULTISPECIES: TIGR04219 family outer membrane beta-barrel protein [unclassified Marinobacter]MBW7470105.1 TIGR04219 family outer membrane beta-barrel protein [Marinobacter sp. F4218]MDK9557631.1 TIGR04219 family outer membrane beta-barrel protein [Marinobacter sp. M216]
MRKLVVAACSSLILSAPVAQADVVGLGANVSYWDSDLSGQATDNGDVVDVENDLNLDSDSNANASLYFEHPVPVLPNVRLNYTLIEQTGRGQLGADFGGIFVGSGVDVRSDLDLEQLDLTLYYEVLDNWVNLDLGLTARSLDGELNVKEIGGTQASKTQVDAVLPMGYVAARFDLPLTGVSVGAEGNFVSYSGDSLHDFSAYGQFEIAVLQLRAGYRQMSIDYEDDDESLDVELDGPFVSAGVVF